MDALREIYMELVSPLYMPEEPTDEATAGIMHNPLFQIAILAIITIIFGYQAACDFVAIREGALNYD